MRKGLSSMLVGLMALLAAGCGVSKEEYMRLENEKKALERDTSKLSQQVNQLTRENEELSYFSQSLQGENRRLLQAQDTLRSRPETGKADEPIDESLLK